MEKVSLNLKNNSNDSFSIETLCTDFICLPLKSQLIKTAKRNFEFLKDLKLADSGNSEEVVVLIGSDFYWSIVTGKVRIGEIGEPVCVETKFGWLLNGPVTISKTISNLSFVNENSHVENGPIL